MPKKGGKSKDKEKEKAAAAAAAATTTAGVEAMEVRHILMEKHSACLKVLEAINTGKIPFNEAARQHSIDKAGRSGLLGWKRRNELDQDFWAAALEVEEGDYTKEPIKTQYGYHIIMVQKKK